MCWCNCRVPSHNPFAGSRHAEDHSRRAVRRATSGDSTSLGLPNRSSLSVPALLRPMKGGAPGAVHDDEMTGDERRRTTESLVWENEPMSAAAAGRSSSSGGVRTSRNSLDAASIVWENEPMSAAATLSSAPRMTLPRVSDAATGQLDGPFADQDGVESAAPGTSRLAGLSRDKGKPAAVSVSSSRPAVLGLLPRRQAPLPPVVLQRSNSFPSHDPEEDFLEFEVTSSLTLKETPRSQRRESLQREIWERQAQIAGRALKGSEAAPEVTESDSSHVSFSFPALSKADADARISFQSNTSADVAAVIDSIMPSQYVDPQTSAAADAMQMVYADHADTAAPSAAESDSAGKDAGQVAVDVVSRHASVISLREFAHSSALAESGDVITTPDVMAV